VRVEDDGFGDGASLDVDHLGLFDYFTLDNALHDGKSIRASVSYNIRWAEDGKPLTIDDGSNFHFSGRQTTAVISWSAHEKGFRFRSDPAHTTTTNFALVGHERNGVFYKAG
jgi:hypothetical protein